MSQIERFHKIKFLLDDMSVVSIETFLQELEISKATFKRDLEFMRDRQNAPIIWDRDAGGYRWDTPNAGKKFELSGLWFSQDEVTALVTMQHLLTSLDEGGLIGPHIKPIMTRINSILIGKESSSDELIKRIKLLGIGKRKASFKCFSTVGDALLKRKQLHINFYSKFRDEVSEREISPQRLIHYRENWYLDAYCHSSNKIKTFGLDGIRSVTQLNDSCIEVSDKKLDAELAKGYGIFSGEATKTAKLKFTPERARWVSSEIWHPEQKTSYDKSGNYYLEFEYSQDPELIMDILRHGPEVEVLEPTELRKKIINQIQKINSVYH
jgi:predicted DNA-binding transcriptional regulator YafY